MNCFLRVCLFALLSVVSWSNGFAAEEYIVNVETVLNVRAAPNSSGEIVGSVKSGSGVVVVEIADGWAKIEYNQGYGYVSSKFLSPKTNSKHQKLGESEKWYESKAVGTLLKYLLIGLFVGVVGLYFIRKEYTDSQALLVAHYVSFLLLSFIQLVCLRFNDSVDLSGIGLIGIILMGVAVWMQYKTLRSLLVDLDKGYPKVSYKLGMISAIAYVCLLIINGWFVESDDFELVVHILFGIAQAIQVGMIIRSNGSRYLTYSLAAIPIYAIGIFVFTILVVQLIAILIVPTLTVLFVMALQGGGTNEIACVECEHYSREDKYCHYHKQYVEFPEEAHCTVYKE